MAQFHRLAGRVIPVLSLIAFGTVLTGFLQPPQSDEGAGAHIFQLAILLLLPVLIGFLVTADWSRPLRSLRPLAVSGVLLVMAFGSLYYLENVRDPGYYRNGAHEHR